MRTKNGFKKNCKKSLRNGSLLFAILILGTGCQRPPVREIHPGLAHEVFESATVGRAQLRSLRAEAMGKVRFQGHSRKFHASILAVDPDRIYVESSGFGMSSAHVSLSRNEMTLYFPLEGEAYQGAAESGLQKLLGLDVSPRRWIPLLLGHMSIANADDLKLISKGANWILTSESKKLAETWTVDSKTGWLKRIDYEKPNGSVIFGEPMKTTAGLFPSKFTIESDDNSLEFRFDRVEPNPAVKDAWLKIDLPPSIPVQPLSIARRLF